ncbi:hypothetical protein [Thioalkalivibrio thiocyanodenitrificans]|uniref:hypothetical protein n=1 Tax=Thioalkalivibrio thiocyanodenitrificans TaxID=243063 RepID=UPI0012EA15A4|nr:hypothetical protein [Thioalkalivibrio thiocyanodenitrificans]
MSTCATGDGTPGASLALIEKAARDFHTAVSGADGALDRLSDLLGVSPESDLCSNVWAMAGAYKGALDAAYGIGGWLEWWWLECRLGEQPMQAGLPGEELRTIATIDDLVKLITDDIKRGA